MTAAEQTRVEYADGRLLGQGAEGLASVHAVESDASRSTSRSRCRPARGSRARRASPRCAPSAVSANSASRPAPARSASTRPGRSRSGPAPATSASSRPRAAPRSRRAPARSQIGSVDGRRSSRTPTAIPGSVRSAGDLRASSANGKIAVDRRAPPSSRRPPTATSSSALSRVARSSPRPAYGTGRHRRRSTVSPAWLELKTSFGNVRNDLEAADEPAARRGGRRDPGPHQLRRHHDPPSADTEDEGSKSRARRQGGRIEYPVNCPASAKRRSFRC